MTLKEPGPLARRFGYTAAIFCNVAILWVFHSLLAWKTPYLTDGWLTVLPAADLSIAANIVANVLYLIHDEYRFRKITEAAANVFGAWFLYTLYTAYPFDTSTILEFDWIIRFCIITGILGAAAGIVTNTLKAMLGRKPKKNRKEREEEHIH